jgi:hypothetical protein
VPSPCEPTPLDELLAALSAQDHRRSQVLRAIESKAASTLPPSTSLQNYFQGEAAAQLRRRR